MRIAVLVLASGGLDAEKADSLTEVLIASIVSRGGVEVVGKEEFQARLGATDAEVHQCLDSSRCLSRVGVELAVDEIVVGTVGPRPEGGHTISISRTEIATAQERARVFRAVPGDDQALVAEVQRAAGELYPEGTPQPAAAPAPAATSAPGARREHEGWVFRAALGGGRLEDRFYGPLHLWEGSATGASGAFEIQAGIVIGAGLVVGGGIYLESVQDPTVEVNGAPSGDVGVGTLSGGAAFLTWYPSGSGLHAQAGIGGARMTIKEGTEEDISDHDPAGVAVHGSVGWEWWIADEITLGAMLRVMYAALTADALAHNVNAGSLLVEATYD